MVAAPPAGLRMAAHPLSLEKSLSVSSATAVDPRCTELCPSMLWLLENGERDMLSRAPIADEVYDDRLRSDLRPEILDAGFGILESRVGVTSSPPAPPLPLLSNLKNKGLADVSSAISCGRGGVRAWSSDAK